MLYYLLQASTPSVPTVEGIVPWLIAFMASMISGIIWYVLKEMRQEVRDRGIASELRQKKVEEGLDRVAESNLMLVVSFPHTSEFTTGKCETMQKDINEARRDRQET